MHSVVFLIYLFFWYDEIWGRWTLRSHTYLFILSRARLHIYSILSHVLGQMKNSVEYNVIN